jgi:hypothetical protein
MRLKKCLAAGCMLAALSVMAKAAPNHDPVLEEAAIRLAVSKLGELRDGFRPGESPRFNQPQAAGVAEKDGDQTTWQDGLAPATDLPRMSIGEP